MFFFSFLHTSMHVPELPYPSENWKISCQTNRKFILQTRNANKLYQNMSHLSYVEKIKWWVPKDFLILWFFQKCMIFLTIPRLILFFRYIQYSLFMIFTIMLHSELNIRKKCNFRGIFCDFFFRTWLVLYHIILLQLHIILIWWEIKLLQTPVLMVIFEHWNLVVDVLS